LTPVVGMVAARLIFGETLSPIEFAGAILVMAGLSFNVLGGPRPRQKRVSHARYQDDTG